jgi:hypothetical protein
MAKKMPYLKLFIGDLKKERTFTCLSLAAKGLWLEMLFIMHDSEPRGFLRLSMAQLSRTVGAPEKEVLACIREMEQVGTFSRDEEKVIFNRRMVRESGISEVRSVAGAAGVAARLNKQNGSKSDTFADDLLMQNGSKHENTDAANGKQKCDSDNDLGFKEKKDGDFDFAAWFELLYATHPKKGHKHAARSLLTQVRGIEDPTVRENFELIHQQWRRSERWQWKSGATAPFFDEYIADETYLYSPPAASQDEKTAKQKLWESA